MRDLKSNLLDTLWETMNNYTYNKLSFEELKEQVECLEIIVTTYGDSYDRSEDKTRVINSLEELKNVELRFLNDGWHSIAKGVIWLTEKCLPYRNGGNRTWIDLVSSEYDGVYSYKWEIRCCPRIPEYLYTGEKNI